MPHGEADATIPVPSAWQLVTLFVCPSSVFVHVPSTSQIFSVKSHDPLKSHLPFLEMAQLACLKELQE